MHFYYRLSHLILNQNNQAIGHSVKNFSILSKNYSITTPSGETLKINSGLLSPWTFNIAKQGNIVASIKKKWSGALKEMYTDADNFLIDFQDKSLDAKTKLLLIALTVLIDLNHFERKN